MSWYSKYLKQDATYWAPASVSGVYQTVTWTTPVAIKVRWEEKSERFVDKSGADLVSSAIVFLNQDVVEGGYLFLGTSIVASPKSVELARPIKKIDSLTDVRNRQTVRKAIL
jgi:hypothetical protein